MAGAGSSGPGSRKPGVGTQEAQAPGCLSFSLPPLQSKVLPMAQDPLTWPLLLSGPRCPFPRCPPAPRTPQPWSNSARRAETGSPCGGQRCHPPGSGTNVTCAERLQDSPPGIAPSTCYPVGAAWVFFLQPDTCRRTTHSLLCPRVTFSLCWSVSFLRTVTVSASSTESRARDSAGAQEHLLSE